MAFSELLRFILPRTQASSGAFAQLRHDVAARGLARTQYFGYVIPNKAILSSLPDNQMCWYIEWPEKSAYRAGDEFKSELAKLASGPARSLLFELIETKKDGVIDALESNACELVSSSLTIATLANGADGS